MARRLKSIPKKDGFFMPAEYETQEQVWMIWPERPDVWRDGGKLAQHAYADVACAIQKFAPVTMCVSKEQYQNCRETLPPEIRVIELSNNDAWVRDTGPIFVKNNDGEVRAVDFGFNAWGGLVNGLYFPWDKDQEVAEKICEVERIDSYDATDFILEGGSITVDGEGTVITTEMCLLDKGRNPHLSKAEIEANLCDYLGCKKVIWLKDGIDPDETNGHVDAVAAFIAPGEVACSWTDDTTNPFYDILKNAYETLCNSTDAKGRKLKVHKLCIGSQLLKIIDDFTIDKTAKTGGIHLRKKSPESVLFYINWLIVNNGVILPQYGDINDSLAFEQVKAMFPNRTVVGVCSKEILYGGGNIHCITQQQPKA